MSKIQVIEYKHLPQLADIDALLSSKEIEINLARELSSSVVVSLLETLSKSLVLEKLILSRVSIESNHVLQICGLIKTCPNLKELSLYVIKVKEEVINEVFKTLSESSALPLQALDVSDLKTPDNKMLMDIKNPEFMSAMLSNNANLKTLKIGGLINLSSQSLQVIVEGLAKNKSLEDLDLLECNIDGDGIKLIANAIKNHPTLAKLNLKLNQFYKEEAQDLFEVFSCNKHFQEVYFDFGTLTKDLSSGSVLFHEAGNLASPSAPKIQSFDLKTGAVVEFPITPAHKEEMKNLFSGKEVKDFSKVVESFELMRNVSYGGGVEGPTPQNHEANMMGDDTSNTDQP